MSVVAQKKKEFPYHCPLIYPKSSVIQKGIQVIHILIRGEDCYCVPSHSFIMIPSHSR